MRGDAFAVGLPVALVVEGKGVEPAAAVTYAVCRASPLALQRPGPQARF
jgi:hypothetical protein